MYANAENEDSIIKITDIALNPILDKDLLKNSLNISAQYCGKIFIPVFSCYKTIQNFYLFLHKSTGNIA